MDIQKFRDKRRSTKSRCEADIVSRKYSVKKEKVHRIAKNAQGSRKGVLGTANRPSDFEKFSYTGKGKWILKDVKESRNNC